jgi:hypothetical protein
VELETDLETRLLIFRARLGALVGFVLGLLVAGWLG